MKKVVIIFVVILAFLMTGCGTKVEKTEKKKVYTIDPLELGEFGEDVILNKDTDMPVTKRTYKLPAGKYIVTTDSDKIASFFIVKDEVGINPDSEPYVEAFEFVGEAFFLTAGEDDFNGNAKKEAEIFLNTDERISYSEANAKLFFTEK